MREPVELKVTNANPVNVCLKNHPSSNLGSKIRYRWTILLNIARADARKLSEGSIIRLMELYNVKITSVELAGDKSRIYADVIGTELSHEIQRSSGLHMTIICPTELLYQRSYIRMNNLIVIVLR